MEKFFQALAALLPTGFAWPREAGSTLMRVLRGIAGAFSEHHDFTTEAVRQWQPATTVNRLAEWEAATGLPDACFPAPLELLGPGRYAVDPVRVANFSRITPATYIDDAGVRQTAPANVPRYEGGLLMLEAVATNRLSNSRPEAWGAYTTGGATGTADLITDPVKGTVLRLTKTAGAVGTRLGKFQSVNGLTGDSFTVSNEAKINVAGSTGVALYVDAAKVGGGIVTVSRSFVGIVGAWADYTATGLAALLGGASCYMWVDGPAGSSIDFAFAQVEIGPSKTSHIETLGAPVTRAADTAYLFPLEAATRDLRRKLLLSRLRGPQLAYDNSSPASPDAIVAICAGLGYVATVAYNLPFRCGVNRVGDRLGALDGKLYVTVTLQSKAFRVGASRVGQRLLEGQLNGGELACYLQRVIPARYQLNMIFI